MIFVPVTSFSHRSKFSIFYRLVCGGVRSEVSKKPPWKRMFEERERERIHEQKKKKDQSCLLFKLFQVWLMSELMLSVLSDR